MNADNNETVAEIVKDMRERCIDEKHSPTLWPYLDRIEAAHKREIAEKDAEIAQLKACRDGECERIKLGAEPCEGCHVQVANDEIDKLRALVAKAREVCGV